MSGQFLFFSNIQKAQAAKEAKTIAEQIRDRAASASASSSSASASSSSSQPDRVVPLLAGRIFSAGYADFVERKHAEAVANDRSKREYTAVADKARAMIEANTEAHFALPPDARLSEGALERKGIESMKGRISAAEAAAGGSVSKEGLAADKAKLDNSAKMRKEGLFRTLINNRQDDKESVQKKLAVEKAKFETWAKAAKDIKTSTGADRGSLNNDTNVKRGQKLRENIQKFEEKIEELDSQIEGLQSQMAQLNVEDKVVASAKAGQPAVAAKMKAEEAREVKMGAKARLGGASKYDYASEKDKSKSHVAEPT